MIRLHLVPLLASNNFQCGVSISVAKYNSAMNDVVGYKPFKQLGAQKDTIMCRWHYLRSEVGHCSQKYKVVL